MTAVSLFDILAEAKPSAGNVGELSEMAAKLVEAALADWKRIEGCERQFASKDLSEPALFQQFNESMHRIYEDWAMDAEQVRPLTEWTEDPDI